MCGGLAELREATAAFAAGFDPALLTGADAARVVKEAAAMENMWAAVKARAATWVADTGVCKSKT